MGRRKEVSDDEASSDSPPPYEDERDYEKITHEVEKDFVESEPTYVEEKYLGESPSNEIMIENVAATRSEYFETEASSYDDTNAFGSDGKSGESDDNREGNDEQLLDNDDNLETVSDSYDKIEEDAAHDEDRDSEADSENQLKESTESWQLVSNEELETPLLKNEDGDVQDLLVGPSEVSAHFESSKKDDKVSQENISEINEASFLDDEASQVSNNPNAEQNLVVDISELDDALKEDINSSVETKLEEVKSVEK